MAKALSLRKDRTKGTQRTRKLSTGDVRGMLRKWEGTLREASLGEWTEGAEPCKVKALSTVLNGGREETCRKVTRLAPTHQGGGNRPFYRWLARDYRTLFPLLPERTRLFRLFTTHQDWTQVFLAAPTVLGVIDTYGIELIHPIREGRSPQQIGRKGLSNHRWIVGGKLCLLLNQWGLIVGWACASANVADQTFQWLIRQVDGRMIGLSDTGFHAAEGDPANLKVCPRGEWQDRMLVETVLSMLTLVCHWKKVMHRGWEYFHARLAFTMAAFNVLVQWHGLLPNASAFVPLSLPAFSLSKT